MNLRDKCKELDISLSEGKEKFGLTHWKQEVVETVAGVTLDIVEAKYAKEVAIVETVMESVPIILTKIRDIIEVSKEEKIGSIKGLGTKSPYWEEKDKLGK